MHFLISIYFFLIAQFYISFTSWLFSENNYFPVLREISNYILCVSTFIYVSSQCIVNMGRKSLNYVSFVVGCMCGCVVAFKRWYCLLTFLCIISQDVSILWKKRRKLKNNLMLVGVLDWCVKSAQYLRFRHAR